MSGDGDPDADADGAATLFTYGAPLVGVLVVAVGIAAAVPGAYALIQADITNCGEPTISVESAEATAERFGGEPPSSLARIEFEALSTAEQSAFEDALDDPLGEADVRGAFPHAETFGDGLLVRYEGEDHYAIVVAENPCFQAAPLQFPLGVFAIALGIVGILTPPAYRRLVALELGE